VRERDPGFRRDIDKQRANRRFVAARLRGEQERR